MGSKTVQGPSGTLDFHFIPIKKLTDIQPTRILNRTHFVEGGLNVLFGPPEGFKSFYALDKAIRVSLDGGSVIYVAVEGSSGMRVRRDAWQKYNEIEPGDVHFVCREINLLDSSIVSAFISQTKGSFENPRLVVFDTYARCIVGGDENSARDAGLAIASLSKIQRELGTTVGLVHHTNRAERGERGSGALRGAADSMIEMSTNDGVINVSCSKLKDWEPWPPERYRFKKVGDSGVLTWDDGSTTAKLSERDLKILEFLSLSIFDLPAGADAKQIAEGTKLAIDGLYKTLSRLKTELWIVQDSRGTPYSLSQWGKLALAHPLSTKAEIKQLLSPQTVKK